MPEWPDLGRGGLYAALFLALTCAACVYPQSGYVPTQSRAFDRHAETRLGRDLAASLDAHPGLTAVHALNSGVDALAARLVLIDRAERAIDFQYYMVNRDPVGEAVVQRLLAAADRGVRVRVLVDDMGSKGVDGWMPALNAHRDIEVRTFNPVARGPWAGLARGLDLVARLGRLNHRMHNKLLAVDGILAVVGGRNIGDEYYGAAETVNFADLDLLVAGPVVADLGQIFDAYWGCEYAVPFEAWTHMRDREEELQALRVGLDENLANLSAQPYAERVRRAAFLEALDESTLETVWAEVDAVADDPRKVVAHGEERDAVQLLPHLRETYAEATRDLVIVSPYFIPGRAGTERLVGRVGEGVRVRVLTNSLAATDVAAVHSGYKHYRRDLLRGGVELYELKPTEDDLRESERRGLLGSSGASLHAKSFCVDERVVFVGSLNLDPRSVDLNTELGLMVHSEDLAAILLAGFERGISPTASWRVLLDGSGDLVWEGEEDGLPVRYTSEPQTTSGERFTSWFLGLLPVESQL